MAPDILIYCATEYHTFCITTVSLKKKKNPKWSSKSTWVLLANDADEYNFQHPETRGRPAPETNGRLAPFTEGAGSHTKQQLLAANSPCV